MYKIAICDDDVKYIEEIKHMIIEGDNRKVEIQFFEYTKGEDLLSSEIKEMDAIFLDIQMKGMNGNEVAVSLNKMGYQGVMIQCSGIFAPTPETIKISPYRYLLKQCNRDEMVEELWEIWQELYRRKEYFEIEASYHRQKVKIKVTDIVYITHHPNGNSVLHLREAVQENYEDGNLIVSRNFKELMPILGERNFAIPHNSYMVNLRYISFFDEKKEFLVVEGKRLSISRAMKQEFWTKFVNYTMKKYERNET